MIYVSLEKKRDSKRYMSYSVYDKYIYNIINMKACYFSYSGSHFPNL